MTARSARAALLLRLTHALILPGGPGSRRAGSRVVAGWRRAGSPLSSGRRPRPVRRLRADRRRRRGRDRTLLPRGPAAGRLPGSVPHDRAGAGIRGRHRCPGRGIRRRGLRHRPLRGGAPTPLAPAVRGDVPARRSGHDRRGAAGAARAPARDDAGARARRLPRAPAHRPAPRGPGTRTRAHPDPDLARRTPRARRPRRSSRRRRRQSRGARFLRTTRVRAAGRGRRDDGPRPARHSRGLTTGR